MATRMQNDLKVGLNHPFCRNRPLIAEFQTQLVVADRHSLSRQGSEIAIETLGLRRNPPPGDPEPDKIVGSRRERSLEGQTAICIEVDRVAITWPGRDAQKPAEAASPLTRHAPQFLIEHGIGGEVAAVLPRQPPARRKQAMLRIKSLVGKGTRVNP